MRTAYSSRAAADDASAIRFDGPATAAILQDIQGTRGNDRLDGTDSADRINGLAGNDRIDGDDGNDVLIGGAGDDRIEGDDGADRIIGGAGADRIEGGDDDDRLSGGAGADTFVFEADDSGDGNDRIADFTSADRIFFDLDDDGGANGYNDLVFRETRAGTIVEYAPNATILLADVTMAQIDQSQFVFG